jgi:hypothetical protein
MVLDMFFLLPASDGRIYHFKNSIIFFNFCIYKKSPLNSGLQFNVRDCPGADTQTDVDAHLFFWGGGRSNQDWKKYPVVY